MKYHYEMDGMEPTASPPARGAWIEIHWIPLVPGAGFCRPPHGGRGLKSLIKAFSCAASMSPPARGAWIEIRYGSGG